MYRLGEGTIRNGPSREARWGRFYFQATEGSGRVVLTHGLGWLRAGGLKSCRWGKMAFPARTWRKISSSADSHTAQGSGGFSSSRMAGGFDPLAQYHNPAIKRFCTTIQLLPNAWEPVFVHGAKKSGWCRATSSGGKVRANRLTEEPSKLVAPAAAQSRMRRAVLTRPTWQMAPRARARIPQIAIVDSFHSLVPPTKIPTRSERCGATSSGIMPSCTAINTTRATLSNRGSQETESARLGIPPATISGATMKSDAAPINATARSNGSTLVPWR